MFDSLFRLSVSLGDRSKVLVRLVVDVELNRFAVGRAAGSPSSPDFLHL